MTIEKEFFGFVVECDRCSYYENFDTEDFHFVIDELKQSGWKIKKDKYDNWEHICPDCQEKRKKE